MSYPRYQPVSMADEDQTSASLPAASAPSVQPVTYDPRLYYSAQGIALPPVHLYPALSAATEHHPQLPAPPTTTVQMAQFAHQMPASPTAPVAPVAPVSAAAVVPVPATAAVPLDESQPFHVEPAHTSGCMKLLLLLSLGMVFMVFSLCAFALFFAHVQDPSQAAPPPPIPSQPTPAPPMSSSSLPHDRSGADMGDSDSDRDRAGNASDKDDDDDDDNRDLRWPSSASIQMEASNQMVLMLVMIYMGIFVVLIPVVYLFRWPRRLELYPTTVVLRTYLASHSVAYSRIEYAELLPSVFCRGANFHSACRQPRGMYTSCSNGMFFASADCGQTLLFSPQDPNRLIAQLRRTTLANRLVAPPS